MNIGILYCQKASNVCTGAACFKAYNNGTHYFSEYIEKPNLCAFFHCGGFNEEWKENDEIVRKMERLQKEGVKRIHIGVCVGTKCGNKDIIASMLREYGFEVVYGTH